MQRQYKYRLRMGNKIVGYEKWYQGNRNSDGQIVAEPKWLYSKDGNYWNSDYIFHDEKDEFTGLLDKNGKEIYIGDTVKIYSKNRKWCGIREVAWDKEKALIKPTQIRHANTTETEIISNI